MTNNGPVCVPNVDGVANLQAFVLTRCLHANNHLVFAGVKLAAAADFDLWAQLDTLKAKHAAAMEELQTLRTERSSAAGRIAVLLFRGDIVYAIVPAAFGDYRAGLRLHAVNDSNFGEALKLFEKLEGGDGALLHVLRQIDGDDDRIIGLTEARSFREQQEGALKRTTE